MCVVIHATSYFEGQIKVALGRDKGQKRIDDCRKQRVCDGDGVHESMPVGRGRQKLWLSRWLGRS